MPEIIDDIDRDEYPHKLEFSRLWMKRAVIALAAAGVIYWVQLIATAMAKAYFFIAE